MFNAKVSYRFFTGATSRDFFHYIKPTLQDSKTNFDIAVLHMDVIDILNLGSTAETASNSILHIANQCKNYGVKDVSVSSATCTTLHNSDLIDDVNNDLQNKSQTSIKQLWKDGLHLTNSGKDIIINNFVLYLNNNHFLIKQPNRQILS